MHLCGCYYTVDSPDCYVRFQKYYLPLVDSAANTTILSTTSRTVLKQTFTNPSTTDLIKQCNYTFPLYDGVSVVGFTCRIGKRVLTGLVKEKAKAKQIFDAAAARGEMVGLLEQATEASDVFTTKLGNIPAGESVVVEVTYIGELKHTETEGIRFTIPTSIAPRYGSGPAAMSTRQPKPDEGIKITVDVHMPEGSFIKSVQSPSHPIAVSMGTISTATNADPTMSKASATLALGAAALEKDFVLIVAAKDVGIPKAILETHPTIPNHRALMATLVPKFSLPPSRPEIVFVADRSGSMGGTSITMLISAMHVLLKSIPVGVKFNICSFGSSHKFLWKQSKAYSQETLAEATRHVNTFKADMGGTETHRAVRATIEQRFSDLPLEVMLLTDGDIWQQEAFFKYLNEQVESSKGNIRVFPLGIGNGVSHALIEGVARAGNGFASAVQDGERLDNSVVRMLRGALSPHITDYTLEVKYEKQQEDFEVVEKVTEGMKVLLSDDKAAEPAKATISLFDTNVNPEKDSVKAPGSSDHLPVIPYPHLHQAPHKIPSLFAFSRASVYLLMSPETIQRNPTAVVLKATSIHGPLSLEIPIEALAEPGTTIHQLAAKKAVQDLEEGRGWIYDAKDQNGKLVKERYPSCFDELVEREAVRLGEKFQIAGKWTSFVAVAANDREIAAEKAKREGNSQFMDVDATVSDEEEEEDYAEAAAASAVEKEEAPPTYSNSAHVYRRSGGVTIGGRRGAAPLHGGVASTRQAIESSLTRGEAIQDLEKSSDNLSKSSQMFRKEAKKKSANPFASAVTDVGGMFSGSVGSLFGNSKGGGTFGSAPQVSRSSNSSVGGFGTGSSFGAPPPPPAPAPAPANRALFGSSWGQPTASAPPMPLQLEQNQYSSPANDSGSSNLFGGTLQPRLAGFSAAPALLSAQPTGAAPGGSSLFGSSDGASFPRFKSAKSAAAPPPAPKPASTTSKVLQSAGFRSRRAPPPLHSSDRMQLDDDESRSSPPKSTAERVLALISLQDFTGCWTPSSSSKISAIFGFQIPSPPAGVDEQTWVTMLVIKVLEDKMPEEEGTWGLVVEKARDWLAGLQVGDLAVLEVEASTAVGMYWVS